MQPLTPAPTVTSPITVQDLALLPNAVAGTELDPRADHPLRPDGFVDLIEDAANILCWRGYLDPEGDEIPADVVDELAQLWHEGPCETCPAWGTADALADHFLARKQHEYERSLPTWACDCGTVYKILTEWGNGQEFYAINGDGLLGDRAGFIKRDSKGKVKHSATCPNCGRSFGDTIARRANPQLSLF
jgi:hypothetical protein